MSFMYKSRIIVSIVKSCRKYLSYVDKIFNILLYDNILHFNMYKKEMNVYFLIYYSFWRFVSVYEIINTFNAMFGKENLVWEWKAPFLVTSIKMERTVSVEVII